MNKLTLVLFVAVFALATADPEGDRAKFKKAHEDCQADPDTKVSEDYMRNAARGEHTHGEEHGKAHGLCMSKKLGFQDEHGKVVKAEVKKVLSRGITDSAKLEAAVAKCAVDKDTPEDSARALWDCIREESGPRGRGPPPHEHH